MIFIFRRVFKEDFNAKRIFDHVCKIFGGKKILSQGAKYDCPKAEALHWCHFCFLMVTSSFLIGRLKQLYIS